RASSLREGSSASLPWSLGRVQQNSLGLGGHSHTGSRALAREVVKFVADDEVFGAPGLELVAPDFSFELGEVALPKALSHSDRVRDVLLRGSCTVARQNLGHGGTAAERVDLPFVDGRGDDDEESLLGRRMRSEESPILGDEEARLDRAQSGRELGTHGRGQMTGLSERGADYHEATHARVRLPDTDVYSLTSRRRAMQRRFLLFESLGQSASPGAWPIPSQLSPEELPKARARQQEVG